MSADRGPVCWVIKSLVQYAKKRRLATINKLPLTFIDQRHEGNNVLEESHDESHDWTSFIHSDRLAAPLPVFCVSIVEKRHVTTVGLAN